MDTCSFHEFLKVGYIKGISQILNAAVSFNIEYSIRFKAGFKKVARSGNSLYRGELYQDFSVQ